MKIVIEISNTTSVSSMRGWSNALNLLGHQVIFYEAKLTPIFDIFDEHNPDMFISTVNDVSRGMAKVLGENPETITVFYSPVFDRVSEENIEYVRELRKTVGKPDLIFSFGNIESIQEWQSHGIKILSLPKAADHLFYTPQPYQPNWGSDITFVGNYDPNLNEYISPLTNQTKWSFRIFGGGDWPCANYVGNVQPENLKNIYSSSRIILDLTTEGSEASDIPFNVLACGGTCFSNSYTEFPGKNELGFYPIWMFKTPDEMIKEIKNHFEIFNLGKFPSKPYVIDGFTYLDRIKELLSFADLEDNL